MFEGDWEGASISMRTGQMGLTEQGILPQAVSRRKCVRQSPHLRVRLHLRAREHLFHGLRGRLPPTAALRPTLASSNSVIPAPM